MSTSFNPIDGGNDSHKCILCQNTEQGQFGQLVYTGGETHIIHKICAEHFNLISSENTSPRAIGRKREINLCPAAAVLTVALLACTIASKFLF